MSTKVLDTNDCTLYHGNAIDVAKNLKYDMVQCCITSPTYWGKRSFTNNPSEFGSESLEEYVYRNVDLYSTILDRMRAEGSLFIVIQDSYMGSGISRSHHNHWETNKDPSWVRSGLDAKRQGNTSGVTAHHPVIKNKSLCAIPYRIAIELIERGYIWRQQIIWEKPNPMPDGARDRSQQSAEYILHFVKNRKYRYNNPTQGNGQVWNSASVPSKTHSATFPKKVVARLINMTTMPNDVVFDPFMGTGTTLDAACALQRKFIGCDIAERFVKESKKVYESWFGQTRLGSEVMVK